MAVRDSSRMSGLFDDSMDMRLDSLEDFRTDRSMIKYEEKIKRGNFGEFNWNDWKKYFISKAKENSIRVISGDARKDKAILESLMGNFTASTIKDMIDFVWEYDHKLVKHKDTIGMWILSKGWIQTVHSLAIKWKAGEDIDGKKPREWKEEKKVEGVPKKKSRISIGGND